MKMTPEILKRKLLAVCMKYSGRGSLLKYPPVAKSLLQDIVWIYGGIRKGNRDKNAKAFLQDTVVLCSKIA